MVDWLAGKRMKGTSSERTSLSTTALGGTGVGGWVELGRTTLGGLSDTITVSSLSDKRYYMVLNNEFANGSSITGRYNFNNDTGSNYAFRTSNNGAADGTATSISGNTQGSFTSTQQFTVGYIANLSGNEKLHQWHWVDQNTAGAGTAPQRSERVGKWANTSNAINRIDLTNVDTADFTSGSELIVLGWDPADTHTNNFWEELASVEGDNTSATLSTGTFTSKKYLWIQGYGAVASGSANIQLRVGNTTLDSGSNYSFRYNDDGGTDGTGTSQTALVQHQLTGNGYFNCFIVNNASNEKLGISHHIFESASGAGTAPQRQEQVGKWANTSNQIDIVGMVEGSGSSKNWVSPSILKVWGAD